MTGKLGSARLFACARCSTLTKICSRCDRGNTHCSPECSAQSRVASIRRAARTYQTTAVGRRNHARRQERYRARRRAPEQKVTHHGFVATALFLSMVLSLAQPEDTGVAASKESDVSGSADAVDSAGQTDSCGFCGRRVSRLVRLTTSSGEDPG